MQETDNLSLEPFFNLSMDLLCIAGYDGYFKKVNPALVQLLGYTEEELFSRKIQEFIHEEDRDLTGRYRENLIKNVPLVNYENRYVSKTGEIIWLHWTSIPLENEKLVYAIAKNITHKKKLEKERIEHLINLVDKNHELKQLNYTTSHDLRSPVNNLLSIFGFLDMSKIEDKEILETLDYMKMATEGLNNSLNNYVDLISKRETSNIDLEVVDFELILKQVKSSISSLLGNANVTFNVDFSNLRGVRHNPSYMESIFLNLLTNSIKYARPDVPPVISITSQVVEGKNQLIYTDNGLGFDMEKFGSKIFGLNQKFHNNGGGDGDSKGVGLYLVYNHINSLGGTIAVESEVNNGVTFTITFK
ncbi:PAS domain-containing sensor histidine kinase [Arenibacter sp. M-2]|uniref:sensor histidine kinase n=1 Tax=unclassified Arenibacter TaxID=2615047 RepID=UPI000D7557EA|nr:MULTISPECIES: PAS domain-containing sensor histidine kinase [unclassified Arenibacter]MDL5510588.1 PAS domain-containing sensor histidine kinase [Arenibacter sp. M-2]PXX25183.1 PAS domain S-box-containing protein [Arenibacter sp. ARW7G5Y1]